jgi:hypothetical protein
MSKPRKSTAVRGARCAGRAVAWTGCLAPNSFGVNRPESVRTLPAPGNEFPNLESEDSTGTGEDSTGTPASVDSKISIA